MQAYLNDRRAKNLRRQPQQPADADGQRQEEQINPPAIEKAEIERAKRKPTESLDAYDYFLRGMASVHQWTSDANDVALRMFRKAIELDPDFASAYGMAAWCYVWRMINRWTIDRAQETTEATRLARRAVDLGADDAVALCMGGYALVFAAHDLDGGANLRQA